MTATSPKRTETTHREIAKWDPQLVEPTMTVLRPLLTLSHRSEVHGLERFPKGGALMVSNHSGGLFPMDVPVFALGFYEKFGYDRPVYTLSHDMVLTGPTPISSFAMGSSAPTMRTPMRRSVPEGW